MFALELLRGIFLVLVVQGHFGASISLPSDPFYIAGVVEFPALDDGFLPEDVPERIAQLRKLLEEAPVTPDIVVLPESVLNNLSHPVAVPHPNGEVVPCANTSYDYILTEISCYARSLQLYLLVNVIEKTEMLTAFYSTNVVFDRRGAVVSRYRKYNLIGTEWEYLNYTDVPELESTFSTDFNVTFGHFTRMDLLYFRPAQALVQQGISDFLHPSQWQSELPFMTAMQLHQAWSYSNNVNLLVAGTNDPLEGRTGSGIYAGRFGALIASMTTVANRHQMHLNVLPKKGFDLNSIIGRQALAKLGQQQRSYNMITEYTLSRFTDRITGIKLGRDSDIDLYTMLPLNDTDAEEMRQRLCHDELCCDFHWRRSIIEADVNETLSDGAVLDHYHYRLAVFKGVGTFLNTEPDVVGVCAIIACVNDHTYTCGRIFDEQILVENRWGFNFIEISANFSEPKDSLVLPMSVDGMLMPLPPDAIKLDVRVEQNVTMVDYKLTKPKPDLLTFGIYVNYFVDESFYDQHHKDEGNMASIRVSINSLLLLFCVLFLCL